jgi:REP element-mobilizing transposase RayT
MRIIYEGAVYHIIQKGNNFEPIFIEDRDRLLFLHLLKECKKKFSLEIHAFCLMDNHIHILLRISKKNLSQSMHWLFMSYAKKISGKYHRKGHLFTSRYKSLLCLNDIYFIQISRYIHLNPVKAGLVENPFNYRWSSCNLFKVSVRADSFVDTDFTLGFFGSDIDVSWREYAKFIKQGLHGIQNLKYPPIIFKDIIGDVSDLRKTENKSVLADLLNIIGISSSRKRILKKNNKYLSFLGNSKRFNIAARDYLIFQSRKKGKTVKKIAQEMKVSPRTVIRATNKVQAWITSYTVR